ncbi:MAG: TfuA domain-containing protein [Myxococcales bacterium]|nr:TfuA domain-containing protein [Myxococcales bacterium]
MRPARADGATIVFVGPSLPAAEVRALAPDAELRPPVAALDVVRLLRRRRPARLVIIDGYFERMAAVWHKELLLALEHGVEVWGAASMGALRAAELDRFGMRGVGSIYRDYRRGRLIGDAEVAVAHLPAEGGYLALSVPLVNVRAVVARARVAGVLDARAATMVVRAAAAIAYWDRTWAAVDAAVPAPARARFTAWRVAHPFDRKADDARALLRTLADTPPVSAPGAPVPRTWAFAQLLALATRRAR